MYRRHRLLTAIFAVASLALAGPCFATTFNMSFSTLNPGLVGLDTIDGVCASAPGGGASNPDINDPSGNKQWGPDNVSRDGKTVSSSPSTPLQAGYHYQLNVSFDVPDDVSQCITVRFKGTKDGVATEGDKAYRMCFDAKTGTWGEITCIQSRPIEVEILPHEV